MRVCRVTAAPVLRTQTYHTSQPDQRPSTCEFCSGHKHTCVAVDGGSADHRGNEAKDGLPVAALAKDANGSNRHLAGLVGVIASCIDREIVQRAIGETLLEQDSDAYKIRPTRPLPHQAHRYHLYNRITSTIVREALGQQGDEVRLSKVHAYLLKELGVNASKDELRPIVEDLLDQQDFEQDFEQANERGQPLTREYIQRHHGSYFRRSLLPEWMTAASPFDGATKITKHNAWRYDRLKPLLNSKYRDKASRTPDSEPARFYRQLMSNEWDGETRSYQLACREFERLVRIGKSRNRRVEVQQHSKRQCTIPATAETTPSNAHQTTAATPTPLPALVSVAALSVAAESHTRACERVSHLLEQERGRWRELYMTAALNAAFTAQPATTDPAAPEPMMSGAGLAESNDTASEAAGGPCTPVSTTISTAGGPASPSREWPCSSIACDGCDQHTPTVRSPCVRVAGFVGGLGMGARRALAARVCWC